MNRRSFIKLAAAAIMSPYLPDIAVPAKVIEKVGRLSASEALGVWFVEKIEEDMISSLRHL